MAHEHKRLASMWLPIKHVGSENGERTQLTIGHNERKIAREAGNTKHINITLCFAYLSPRVDHSERADMVHAESKRARRHAESRRLEVSADADGLANASRHDPVVLVEFLHKRIEHSNCYRSPVFAQQNGYSCYNYKRIEYGYYS